MKRVEMSTAEEQSRCGRTNYKQRKVLIMEYNKYKVQEVQLGLIVYLPRIEQRCGRPTIATNDSKGFMAPFSPKILLPLKP
jgi:hypothetical protein